MNLEISSFPFPTLSMSWYNKNTNVMPQVNFWLEKWLSKAMKQIKTKQNYFTWDNSFLFVIIFRLIFVSFNLWKYCKITVDFNHINHIVLNILIRDVMRSKSWKCSVRTKLNAKVSHLLRHLKHTEVTLKIPLCCMPKTCLVINKNDNINLIRVVAN